MKNMQVQFLPTYRKVIQPNPISRIFNINKGYMILNDIKKHLYKQNPTAKLSYIRKGQVYYIAYIREKEENDHMKTVIFEIPFQDMGEATFFDEMESKLLI